MSAAAQAMGESFGGSVIGCYEAWSDGEVTVNDFAAPAFAGLDALGLFLDPVNWVVGNLLEPILDWILDKCKPLKDLIESITGSPEEVRAQADQYQQVSEQVAQQANQIVEAVNQVLSEWEGQARDAFRAAAEAAVQMQKGIANAQHQLANLFYALGALVSAVKEVVVSVIKELITDLVTKGIMAALAAVPSLGSAVAAYMTWAAAKYALVMGKLARTFQKLADEASKIVRKGSEMGKFFDDVADLLQKLAGKFGDMAQRFEGQQDLLDEIDHIRKEEIERHDRLGEAERSNAEDRRSQGKDREADLLDRRAERAEARAEQGRRDVEDRQNQFDENAGEYGPGLGTAGVEGAVDGATEGAPPDNPNPADTIGDIDR